MINPVLELSDELQDGEEGCLSIPEVRFDCFRSLNVIARGMNEHGEPIVIQGTDYLARILQHETDHLDGIVFLDRMDLERRKIAMKEIREKQWFKSGATIKISPHAQNGLIR